MCKRLLFLKTENNLQFVVINNKLKHMSNWDIDLDIPQSEFIEMPESLEDLMSVSVSTLDELLSLYYNLAYFRALRGYRYLYRGHSSSSYSLQPTISRSSNASKENESHIYNRFKQICRNSECAQFKLDNSNEDLYYMSIARHLGLKSRLLDWTAGFWIALSFLLYDNLDLDGTLWIIAQKNDIPLENTSPLEIKDDDVHFFKETCVIPENKLLNDLPLGLARSYRQHSYFTATSLHNTLIPLNNLQGSKDIEFYHVTIPANLKKQLLECENIIDVNLWLYLRRDDTLINSVNELNELFEV